VDVEVNVGRMATVDWAGPFDTKYVFCPFELSVDVLVFPTEIDPVWLFPPVEYPWFWNDWPEFSPVE
jgi:hypothetical protein